SVLADEILDHVVLEPLGQIPDVERDSDHVGGPPGVPGVLERAAAPGSGAVGARIRRERHVNAGDVVLGRRGPGRGHRGIDAAGQGGQNAEGFHSALKGTRGEAPFAPSPEPHRCGLAMGIFGRRPRESPAPPGPAVAEFWEWWATVHAQFETGEPRAEL